MRGLKGRTVLVTGAASGIGRATAERLLEEGCSVMGTDLAQALGPSELPRDTPDHRWAYLAADVTDEPAVAALVSATVDRFGRIDGAVTAAGVAGAGPVHMLDAAEWQRVLSVNLTGTFFVAKHVIAQLLAQPANGGHRGSVVTLASIEGLEGTAGGSVYCASKGAVVLLTKNMAIDYGASGIRVNAICPGFIETPMLSGVFKMPGMEPVLADITTEHKLRRLGKPSEIAASAAFLLSDDASFVTGHALCVDGGYTSGRDHGVTNMLGLSGSG